MVQNPPEGMQRVIPYLVYSDSLAAIELLTEAFGFEGPEPGADGDASRGGGGDRRARADALGPGRARRFELRAVSQSTRAATMLSKLLDNSAGPSDEAGAVVGMKRR